MLHRNDRIVNSIENYPFPESGFLSPPAPHKTSREVRRPPARSVKTTSLPSDRVARPKEDELTTDPLSVGFALIRQRAEEAQRELQIIQQLLARCDSREALECDPADSAPLATRIANYVEQVEVDVVPTPDDIPPKDQSDFEREEWRELRAAWKLLRPFRDRLCDPGHVTALLTSQTVAKVAVMKRLRHVLVKLEASSRWSASEESQRFERVRLKYGSGDILERLARLRGDSNHA